MKLTDYYKCEELTARRSHRFDCTASTGSYGPFERIAARSRGGRLFFYYNGIPDNFRPCARRNAERAISNKKNISSVFIPSLDTPLDGYGVLGYGDTRGTYDALLFVFSPDYKTLEIFVARGKKYNQRLLYRYLCEGRLWVDLYTLRASAKPVQPQPRPHQPRPASV